MGDHSDVEQIKAVNHHLRIAVDQIGDEVVIMEPAPLFGQGPKIVFANTALEKTTGLSHRKLVGKQFSQIYPGEELGTLFAHLAAAIESGSPCPIESGIRLGDGSTRPCQWTARPILDPDGEPLSIILTARMQPGAALAAPSSNPTTSDLPSSPPPLPKRGGSPVHPDAPPATSNLSEAHSQTGDLTPPPEAPSAPGQPSPQLPDDEFLERNRLESLAMLAGGIAHDFRNSLTAIIANTSLAKPLTEPGSELEQHLEDVESAAEGARELTSHLLAFARGSKPKREPSDIARLVKESIQLATYGASVKCRVTMDDDLWHSEVDRTQIKQVLNNLIINAWQAMPGGGTIRLTAGNTQVSDDMNIDLRPGRYVSLAVRDRGCGISPENLRRVFEPFFTTKATGSGIGLATCYSVIKQHDGDITVRSKEHVGTEFRVFIPACHTNSKPKKGAASGLRDELIPGTGDILVVDDQGSVRNVATMILKKLGYGVKTAADGETAVKLYDSRKKENRPFSAVLMDMTLPGGMNGEEAFRELKRIDPTVRAIASSGFFEDDAHASYRKVGFTNILPKPYSASVLSKSVHDSIHGPLP